MEKPKEEPSQEDETKVVAAHQIKRAQNELENAPEHFAKSVMICGVQQEQNEATPEFLYLHLQMKRTEKLLKTNY